MCLVSKCGWPFAPADLARIRALPSAWDGGAPVFLRAEGTLLTTYRSVSCARSPLEKSTSSAVARAHDGCGGHQGCGLCAPSQGLGEPRIATSVNLVKQHFIVFRDSVISHASDVQSVQVCGSSGSQGQLHNIFAPKMCTYFRHSSALFP